MTLVGLILSLLQEIDAGVFLKKLHYVHLFIIILSPGRGKQVLFGLLVLVMKQSLAIPAYNSSEDVVSLK